MEAWTTAARADRTLALSWDSGASALILALAELLLLVWLLVRWLVRRQGGRRRAWRRLVRQVRLTRQAFSEPVREFLRFRAAVRRLTRLLASDGPVTIARHALDGVDAEVRPTAPQAFGFAVAVRPATRRSDGEVAVSVAGRGVPPPGHPWETEDDPLLWYASAVDAEGAGAGLPADAPRVLVPLGLSDDGAVFLDLMRGPRILTTYGDRRAVRDFVQAVAAYLDLPGGPADVLVTRGVHPRFDGPDLDEVLHSLVYLTADRTRPVVVVCAAPDDEQAARLAELAGAGLLCAVVVGPVSVHRWEIRVNSRGRTETPGLDITTDAAPLGPAVARVARVARRIGSRRPRAERPTGGAVPSVSGAVRSRSAGPRPPAGPQPPAGPRPPIGGPESRRPLPEPVGSGTRPGASLTAEPASTASVGTTAAPSASTTTSTPAEPLPPAPTEPLSPAIRDLFAEPEISGVSAAGAGAGSGDPDPLENPRAERRNES
ncbi:hypothetical protein SAMN06272735_8784 [Streptomyces sp. TLI_55]|uniref:hypothetical protein n=1 Tax=Streptomyces sp. TLI_55 TaxID=1938861 RepID=UPI000BC5ED10|nr:hypothetical protein [Streptomyces sp. TLI_55]SNX88343.1 hypothetical protein SAMN06272735_8784 [Streptomyces sp. TLI_55]